MVLVCFSLLGQDDGVLEEEHPSPVLCSLHQCEVALPQDLALLHEAPLQGRPVPGSF